MILRNEQYRVFEHKNWVFLENGPETAAFEKPSRHSRDTRTLSGMLQAFEKNYGESAYRQMISEQAAKLIGEKNEHSDRAIEDSVKRYTLHYQEIRVNFINESENLNQAYTSAEKRIENKTQEELKRLKSDLETGKKLKEKSNETFPKNLDRNGMNRYFENYLETLNEHYFKVENEIDRLNYRSETGKLKNNIELWVQNQINLINKNKGTQSDYEALKKEIDLKYQHYASLDRQPSNISTVDLKVINRQAPTLDNIEDFFEKATPDHPNYPELMRRMEDFALMHPDVWKKEVDDIARNIIDQVEADRVENQFTSFVNTNIESIKNFREGKKAFLKHMEGLASQGVQKTTEFINKMTSELLKDTLNPEKERVAEVSQSVSKTFGKEVGRQMDYLMSGATVPEKETDKILVHFMRGDEEERRGILSNHQNSQLLARAIAEATEGYPEIYKEKYSSLPKEVTHSKDLGKPTTHDMAARLQALIILGGQAKNIVGNYSQKILSRINEKQVNPKNVQASLKFTPVGEKNIRVRSRLDRGGFNSRDIGLKILKVFGALTVVTNFFQAFSETAGAGNIFTRLALTIPQALSNPVFMLSAGVTTLAYKSEQDPRYLKWPWLSPHEKADVRTADRLRSIGSKVGEKKRDEFLANLTEWKVIKRMNKQDVEKLIAAAQKNQREGKKVGISPDLLVQEGIINKEQDAELYYHLSQGSNRTRYLFYEKFLHSEGVNVHDVKEHCTGSSFIS